MAPLLSDRVLLADGDPGLRRQIQKRLLDANVYADSVDDGGAALDLLRQRSYAVVLLGLVLPDRGAERVLEFLGKSDRESRPVVLMVGEPSAARSLDVDLVQIVLRKPCNLTQLADMIQSCVQNVSAPPEEPQGLDEKLAV